MPERKTYLYRFTATGSITVRGDSPADADDNAKWAIRNLITADAGTVSVDSWELEPNDE